MASSLLGAFTSLISRRPWSDLPSSFCFTIGKKVPLPYGSVFQLFDGVNMTDKTLHLNYARNCLKSIRTIRHPYILRTLEAVEVPSGIYIATEHVRPLVSSDIPSDPIWGLFQIVSATEFLNTDVKSIHGLICPYSIFITVDEAHWRLGGFDVVCPISNSRTFICPDFQSLIQSHPLQGSGYSPPLDTLSPFGLDRWGLVSVIAWVHASLKATDNAKNQLRLNPEDNLVKVPSGCKTYCKQLLQQSKIATEPLNFKSTLATNPFFSESDVLKVMLFFENINLKGNWEKESFFAALPEVLSNIPSQIQYLQILPQLSRQLEVYDQPAALLPCLLVIVEALIKGNLSTKADVFRDRVIPVVTKLFKCPDRALRYSLLQNLPLFDEYMSPSDVEEVFDPFCLGFTDSSNLLREETLKAMCYLVPKLKKPSSMEKAVRLMTRIVQQDPEGSIRTNAVICFAKLISTFSKDQQGKIITTAFLGALRDSFPPCRLAALQSIALCSGQDIFSANDIVTRIIPTVCQRCVDPENQVRGLAFASLEALLYQARLHLDVQPMDPHDTNGDQPNVCETTENTSQVSSPASVLKQQSDGWTKWALKRAINFYGSKESGSLESASQVAPSGKFIPGQPSPPPPNTKLNVKRKADQQLHNPCDDPEVFFDAAEINRGEWDIDEDLWDGFDDSAEFQDEAENSQKKETRRSVTATSIPISSIAPPPSAVSTVNTSPSSRSSQTSPLDGVKRPYEPTPTTFAPSILVKSVGPQLKPASGRVISQLPKTLNSTKPSTDPIETSSDFWAAFDGSVKQKESSTTAGKLGLKEIIAKKSRTNKRTDDPFNDFL